jgi:hypothetical protein
LRRKERRKCEEMVEEDKGRRTRQGKSDRRKEIKARTG